MEDRSERVTFFSTIDMAAPYELKKAEAVLNNINTRPPITVNDFLELYHIKLYFDNKIFSSDWDENKKESFLSIIANAWIEIKTFLFNIDDTNIKEHLRNINFNYRYSFWELVEDLSVFKKISRNNFTEILNSFQRDIRYILSCKKIVDYFNHQLKEFLFNYPTTAELLLKQYVEEKDSGKRIFYFPKSLTLSDKETILSKYLESPEVNLNYVRLITNGRDCNELKISPKLKLKSKRKAEELTNEIFENGHSWKMGVQVAYSLDQKESVKKSYEDNIETITYGKIHFDEQNNNLALFHIFSGTFSFTDDKGLIQLVNRDFEMDIIEKTLIKSKYDYPDGIAFRQKSLKSSAQLYLFEHYLHTERERTLEDLINSYMYDFLIPNFNITGMRFKFPSQTSSFLERIRIFAPELEFLLKQYKLFVENKNIDFELLQIDSTPLHYSSIPSLSEKKYIYFRSDLLYSLKFQFYSDQSHLFYTEKFTSKYDNLFELLLFEEVSMDDFRDYQQHQLKRLIHDDYLFIDEKKNIKIKQFVLLYLIGEYHRNEVLSYWRYPKHVRVVIDQMIENDLVDTENNLLTKSEQQYFNFYMNKKEFTNGFDLRNKYLHGSNSDSEVEQKNDYYILLKILILILLKIEDDLLIKNYLEKI